MVHDLDLDSARVQLDTLGHTPTLSLSVKNCHLCFLTRSHLVRIVSCYRRPLRPLLYRLFEKLTTIHRELSECCWKTWSRDWLIGLTDVMPVWANTAAITCTIERPQLHYRQTTRVHALIRTASAVIQYRHEMWRHCDWSTILSIIECSVPEPYI